MGEQPGKGPESGGNLGPSRNFQLLGRLERLSPGFRRLAGPVGPGEGCGLWLMTVGTGEAEEVMAGSIFQMLRESWVPSYRMGWARRWGAGLYSPEDWRGVQHRSLKDHHGLLCGLCPAQNTSKRMGWQYPGSRLRALPTQRTHLLLIPLSNLWPTGLTVSLMWV